MNPMLPDLSNSYLPEISKINLVIPHFINSSLFVYGFYLIAGIVIFISLFLFWHWKEYGEDWIQGIAIYALYGFGTTALLLNIYSQIQKLI